MTNDQVRELLNEYSPAIVVMLLVLLTIMKLTLLTISEARGPSWGYIARTVVCACITIIVLHRVCTGVLTLRPWAAAIPWSVSAYYLVKKVGGANWRSTASNRTRPSSHFQKSMPTTSGNTHTDMSTHLADPKREPVVPVRFDNDVFRASDIIHLTGEITPKRAATFLKECQSAGAGRTITVDVNSGGGGVSAARSMYAALRMLEDGNTVYVFVSGQCCSMAISVIMAIPAERRVAAARAEFMIHSTTGESDAGIDRANADFIVSPLVEGTRIDDLSLRDLLKKRVNYYFGAPEALELGLVSQIAD